MESVVAKRISYLVETYKLLPQTHMGGRRMTLVETAVQLLVKKTYAAWKKARQLGGIYIEPGRRRSIRQRFSCKANSQSEKEKDTNNHSEMDRKLPRQPPHVYYTGKGTVRPIL